MSDATGFETGDEQLFLLLRLIARDAQDVGPFDTRLVKPGALARYLGQIAWQDDQGESPTMLLSRLAAGKADLSALRRTKEAAKKMAPLAATPLLRGAALTLYHAAIAAAFAWHGEDLSSRPVCDRLGLYEDLASLFGELALGDVFRAACDRAWTSAAPLSVPVEERDV